MRSMVYCAAVIIEDKGRVLVERRGEEGMWAGLWQAPTLEGRRRAARRRVEAWIGGGVRRVERFEHATTHRRVEFEVWRADRDARCSGGVWKTRREVGRLGLSNPMRRILLGSAGGEDGGHHLGRGCGPAGRCRPARGRLGA